jgi:hypothetical protein
MTLLVKYLEDPLVLRPTQVAQTSDPQLYRQSQQTEVCTRGNLNPAKQKPNDSRFVFTSDMFIFNLQVHRQIQRRENKHRD